MNNGTYATSEEDKARATTMRRIFVAFLIGGRACVGKALAYLEVSVTIAKIISYLDFSIAGRLLSAYL